MRSTWPLGGRDGDVARVAALLRRHHGVLLAGPAGVGKSSIATLVGQALEAEGWSTTRLVASATAAAIPLGALAPVLPRGDDPSLDAPALVEARTGITGLAAGQPLLLILDDAQWLDEASAVVLHQLVAAGEVTLLATLRAGEPPPEPVTALWKDGLVDRLEVAPLDEGSVLAVLEQALDGPVETVTARHLWQRCAGNALYLRELVAEAVRQDLFDHRDGLWCLDALPPGSPRLAELLGQRLASLGAPEREALELVAVGEPIELDLLASLVEPAAVERLEADGFVAVGTDGARHVIRTAHPLYGDVVRATLPDLRNRRLVRSLADALEATGAEAREDVLRLATWRLQGGGTPAPGLLLAAARQAHFAFDGAAAERLARAAWASDRSFEAAQVLADVLFARGGFAEREQLLADLALDAGTDEQVALVAVARAIGWFWGLADGAAADRVLAAAEASVASPAWWSEVRATRATLASQAGRHRDALGLLDGLPPDLTSPRAALQSALAEGFALSGVGRAGDAVERIDAAIAAAAGMGQQVALFRVGLLLSAKAMALVALGRLEEAADAAGAGLEASVATGNRAAAGFFGATLGWVQLHQGLLVTAQRTYRESAVAFRSSSHAGPLRWAIGGLLLAAAQARDPEVTAEARRVLDGLGTHPAALFDTAIGRARAWASVADGDPERARTQLRDAAAEARDRGAVHDEAAALHDLARLGRADAVVERLRELSAAGQGALLRALADSAGGLGDGDAGALGEVAERFEDMGFHLRAAETAMAASEASARAGDQRAAARWAHRATELAARCEAPATPELLGRSGPVPLTVREREIAQLAASGLASKVIAERLYLSARTVDNHLTRIYAKLGVRGRAELREVLDA